MNEEDLLNLPGVSRSDYLAAPAPVSKDDEEEDIVEEIQQPQQTTEQQPLQPTPPQQPQPDGNAGMDNPLSGFLENAAVGVRDFIDNNFQGDQLTREEIAGNREEMRNEEIATAEEQRTAADQNIVSASVAEGTRATLGGVAGVVEQPVRFAQEVLGKEATFNLGIAENKTAVGNFARTTLTMLGLMKGASKIPGLGGGAKSAAGRLAKEAAKGAVADFVMEAGDGNMFNMLNDMFPGANDLNDTFLTALKHEDDDNIWIRKLKNMGEGAIFGTAVDGIGELYSALRQARKIWQKTGNIDKAMAVINDPELTKQAQKVMKEMKEIKAKVEIEENIKRVEDAARQAEIAADPGRQTEIDFSTEPRQMELSDFGLDVPESKGFDPGLGKRIDESIDNNARTVDTNMWEPNERAAKTMGFKPNEVLESQIDQAIAGNPVQGSSKGFMVDQTFKAIQAAPDTNKAIAFVIKAMEEGTDIKALIKKMRTTNARQLTESFPIVEEFISNNKNADGTTNWNALQKMVKTDTGGTEPAYMTIEGGIAVRGLQKDLAFQMRDIAQAQKGVDEIGGDSYRQQSMLIDRLRVLDRMNLFASYDSGTRQQARNIATINVRKALETGEIDGSVAKRIQESTKKFDELQSKLESGDPKAKAEFETLADSLALADGDPEKVLKFWDLFRRTGASGLKSGLYNGFLSSTTSQIRNITGNAFNLLLRPTTQAIGFLTPKIENGKVIGPDIAEARIQMAAYSGLLENINESFKIAKMSWDSTSVDSQAVRFDDGYSAGSARKMVDQAMEMAETNGEKAAAQFLNLQYAMFSNPWMKMPTRGLGATDDAVRTLLARMELKKDAMRNSFEKGQGFKVDADRYAKLVDLKIDGRGNILDQQLLDTAKDVTFQTELTAFGRDLQGMADRNMFLKLMFPFIRTPLNIMKTTFTFVPGANRFVKDYRVAMKGNDEALKALYRGREAAGVMTIGSAMALASSGNLTGRGPVDREKREIWLQNHQPNSVRTPFGWVSYETLEPINTIFSMAADLTQLANAGNDTLYEKTWAQAAYTISSSLVDKSYFKGLIDMSGLFDLDDSRWGYLAGKKATETLNTVLFPYSGARAQLSKLLAPGKQEFDGFFEETMASAFPGGRNVFGAQRVDIFTKKEMNPFDYGGHVWNTLTPFDVGSSDNNNLAGRLGELGVDINFQFSDTFKGIKLSSTERQMLNKYIADTDLGKELDRLMDKKWFKDAVEGWKDQNLSSEGTRWMRAISQELSWAKRQAKARMLRENPTFAEKVNLNTRLKRLLRLGRDKEAASVQKELQELIDFN